MPRTIDIPCKNCGQSRIVTGSPARLLDVRHLCIKCARRARVTAKDRTITMSCVVCGRSRVVLNMPSKIAERSMFCHRCGIHARYAGRTPADVFWPRVDKNGPIPPHRPELGPCWIWTAARNDGGYGRVHLPGQRAMLSATHLAFFFQFGRWPKPLALHHCDNPPCVRWDHLFEGTHKDNHADMVAKGRNRLQHVRREQPKANLRIVSTDHKMRASASRAKTVRSMQEKKAIENKLARPHVRRTPIELGAVQKGDTIGDWRVLEVRRDSSSDRWLTVRCEGCGHEKTARADNLRVSVNRCRWKSTDRSPHVGRPPTRR
jgi:hypothetical protein